GFVGAIAYYARGQALAVGGTGRYPYREFSSDTTTDPNSDPSGTGAAWEVNPGRFGDAGWHPYGQAQLPSAPNLDSQENAVQTPMRALTALDCSQVEAESCVAG